MQQWRLYTELKVGILRLRLTNYCRRQAPVTGIKITLELKFVELIRSIADVSIALSCPAKRSTADDAILILQQTSLSFPSSLCTL